MRHVPKMLLQYLRKNNPKSMINIGAGRQLLDMQLYFKGLLPEEHVAIDVSYSEDQDILLYKTNKKFELVVCDQVIEHIKQQHKAIQKMRDLLSSDGTLFISSITKRPWAWYKYRSNGATCLEPTHVREYKSLREFRGILECNGLDIIEAKQRQFFLKYYIPVPGFNIVEVLCQRSTK